MSLTLMSRSFFFRVLTLALDPFSVHVTSVICTLRNFMFLWIQPKLIVPPNTTRRLVPAVQSQKCCMGIVFVNCVCPATAWCRRKDHSFERSEHGTFDGRMRQEQLWIMAPCLRGHADSNDRGWPALALARRSEYSIRIFLGFVSGNQAASRKEFNSALIDIRIQFYARLVLFWNSCVHAT